MLPEFRYHPDPLKTGAFEQGDPQICQSCGKETKIWYVSPIFCRDSVHCLCPACIADGSAAKKFDAEFTSDVAGERVSDPEKIDILQHRTPGYHSWQEPVWYAHCGDFCAFLGDADSWEDLENMGIAAEIEETFDEEWECTTLSDLKEWLNGNSSLQGYLFRCLHCGKHFLHIDCD